MNRHLSAYVWAGLLCALLGTTAAAQENDTPPGDGEAHQQLRALREKVVEAFIERDIDTLLECLADDVVVVFQNGEKYKGHDGVRAFHEEMSEGDDRKVKSLETEFEVDELAILYGGDTAVAHGSVRNSFDLARGLQFDLASAWTATVVKQDDRWLIASFHVSTNMFDNGVMDAMMLWNSVKVGAIAFVVGVLLAVIVAKLRSRKPSSTGRDA